MRRGGARSAPSTPGPPPRRGAPRLPVLLVPHRGRLEGGGVRRRLPPGEPRARDRPDPQDADRPGRRVPEPDRAVQGRALDGARVLRPLRDPLRGAPGPPADPPAGGLGGVPAPEGLRRPHPPPTLPLKPPPRPAPRRPPPRRAAPAAPPPARAGRGGGPDQGRAVDEGVHPAEPAAPRLAG